MEGSVLEAETPGASPRESRDSVVIRFAGDSGDGMQLTGSQFTLASALAGNDLATFPDFPAEIRAPAGTTFGVSAFQIQFSSKPVLTAGDAPHVLVAMNPAALKVNIQDLTAGGIVVADTSAFTKRNLQKAGYENNPLEDGSLSTYRVIRIDITKMTLASVEDLGLSNKEAVRCKNMWALGLMMWMYDRERNTSVEWLNTKFGKSRPEVAKANIAALNAGHAYGETVELDAHVPRYFVPKTEDVQPGLYRTVNGSDALSWGLAVGCHLAELRLFFGSYPITPASSLLHTLSRMKGFDIVTFQAEDEIAAVCSAIGASYAGSLGITSSSGPGVALKTEAIGLAVVAELPLIIVNSQRAGPSTGMPTKTEQSDLLQAVYGRNADTPLVVMATHSPSNCFEVAIEAVRISSKYMTPVILLTDGYLANASEPWLIPDLDSFEKFPVTHRTDPDDFHPYARDAETLARSWAVPGTPGLEHRIGGLEKSYGSGNISYDPANHQKMTDARFDKVKGVAKDLPLQKPTLGETSGRLAIVGWGSTFGPIHQAVRDCREEGLDVAQIHVTHLNPFPTNLGELLGNYDKILVPEMNNGQLDKMIRDQFLLPAKGFNKVTGQPFKVSEIKAAIRAELEA